MKEFKCEVVEVLKKAENGDTRTEIRMVRWNDRPEIKLEKRSFYRPEGTNDWMMGKAMGFNDEDLQLLFTQQKHIMEVMNGKVITAPAKKGGKKRA